MNSDDTLADMIPLFLKPNKRSLWIDEKCIIDDIIVEFGEDYG